MNARFNLPRLAPAFAVILLMATGTALQAQTYSIDWHKIAGGGGTSTNTQFAVTGTIGQHDASAAMTAGGYSVTGGFWSIINVVQAPGTPTLTIVTNGPNSLKVFWLDPAINTYTLQQSADLASANWVTSGFSISHASGTNSISINSPVGKLYFRLKSP